MIDATKNHHMDVEYRFLRPGEENAVCHLVLECFYEFIATDFSAKGVSEFLHYVNPKALKERLCNSYFVIVASVGSQIIGIIEIRSNNHISLFFVKTGYQNRGIGRKLLRASLDYCRQANPLLDSIDVYSSPYAVKIYEKLGFSRSGIEQDINGIKVIPMKIPVLRYE